MRYLIFSILLVNYALASMLLYIGEEGGENVAGIVGSTKLGGLVIQQDVRSYINGEYKNGFLPNKIMYKTSFKKQIDKGYLVKIEHVCIHNVDRPEEKRDAINQIELEVLL